MLCASTPLLCLHSKKHSALLLKLAIKFDNLPKTKSPRPAPRAIQSSTAHRANVPSCIGKTFKLLERTYLFFLIINENQLLTKAYAVCQNAQHNSISTAINSKAAKIASLSRDAITADDILPKINKIADAFIQFSEILKLQSNQFIAIKNVVVASALFQSK